jgi:N-acetylneuraminate lyase
MMDKLRGLVAATHTPFDSAGGLELAVVETQAEHLVRAGVIGVFIGGTTGEFASLTVDERLALAARWAAVVKGTALRLVVHVGANCLADARALAKRAEQVGAVAVAAVAPSYSKPRSLDALVACCRDIAAAAPATPFYYYDMLPMTGITLSSPEFLDQALDAVPTLAGVKFSNPDLFAYQRCLHAAGGRFDMPWGIDECLLAALAVGGVTAPIANRLLAAFASGDLETARAEQYHIVQLVELLSRFGFMAAAKATMGFLGVPVGAARLPHTGLTADEGKQLRAGLDALGFFEWVKK